MGEIVNTGEKCEAVDLLKILYSSCADARGKEITVLDVSSLLDLTKYFVIVSGRSDRHVQGISNRVLAALESCGISPLSIEGLSEGHWALIDCDDVVVHVFYEPVRQHYDLESLWIKAPRLTLESTGASAANRALEAA